MPEEIIESQWRMMDHAASECAAIASRASNLITLLTHVFDREETQRDTGLKFARVRSGNLKDVGAFEDVQIDSPICTGRVRLEYYVNETGIRGRLIVERKSHDVCDQVCWLKAYQIGVPGKQGGQSQGFCLGDAGAENLPIADDRQGLIAAFTCGMSIYYALAAVGDARRDAM